ENARLVVAIGAPWTPLAPFAPLRPLCPLAAAVGPLGPVAAARPGAIGALLAAFAVAPAVTSLAMLLGRRGLRRARSCLGAGGRLRLAAGGGRDRLRVRPARTARVAARTAPLVRAPARAPHLDELRLLDDRGRELGGDHLGRDRFGRDFGCG